MITLTLPYPPSVNHLYAVVNGRKVLSAKGRAYQDAVVDSWMRQRGAGFGDLRVRYHVHAFPPDHRRRDLSNLCKIVEDSLTKAGVWGDDSQVDDMRWTRGTPTKGGSLFVTIEAVTAGEVA